MRLLPKLSIIIPVYNVEKFLQRNIESLLGQTHSNIELIYVDDGSTDKSGFILDNYKKKDSRIKVIHNTNHGVSYTRNCGIDNSTGDYVTFVDGDDYVDTDYAEYLLRLVEDNNTMMGVSLFHHIDDSMSQDSQLYFECRKNTSIIDDIYLNKIYMAVWNKIYKRDFLCENKIRFCNDIWYAEGMHFNIQCLARVGNVAVGNKRVYHYITNANSAMRKCFNIKNEECALRSLNKQREILKELGLVSRALEYHYMMVCYMILCGVYSLKKESDHTEQLERYINSIKNRKYIPLNIELSLKNKIKWITIGFLPKYIALIRVFIEKRRLQDFM